jgi:hypothetical protein
MNTPSYSGFTVAISSFFSASWPSSPPATTGPRLNIFTFPCGTNPRCMYTALAVGALSRYMGVGGSVLSACSIAHIISFLPTPLPWYSGQVNTGDRNQCGSSPISSCLMSSYVICCPFHCSSLTPAHISSSSASVHFILSCHLKKSTASRRKWATTGTPGVVQQATPMISFVEGNTALIHFILGSVILGRVRLARRCSRTASDGRRATGSLRSQKAWGKQL